jgi:hypothetical protein
MSPRSRRSPASKRRPLRVQVAHDTPERYLIKMAEKLCDGPISSVIFAMIAWRRR